MAPSDRFSQRRGSVAALVVSAAIVVVLATLLFGCGGSSSTTTSGAKTPTTTRSQSTTTTAKGGPAITSATSSVGAGATPITDGAPVYATTLLHGPIALGMLRVDAGDTPTVWFLTRRRMEGRPDRHHRPLARGCRRTRRRRPVGQSPAGRGVRRPGRRPAEANRSAPSPRSARREAAGTWSIRERTSLGDVARVAGAGVTGDPREHEHASSWSSEQPSRARRAPGT